ncbi:hypothetical protein C8J56DRAFT_1063688 [Mycena floridula]|nr:hypothetical protein C8J56DRAFT_1063688 [Mycena floridula]
MQFYLPSSFNSTCLPNELVHLIFQHAAAGDPELCKALCFVSSWARKIALPYLRPLLIRDFRPVDDLVDEHLGLDPSWIPPSQYTKHLWFDSQSRRARGLPCPPITEITAQVFPKYPALESVALPGDCFLYLAEEWEKNNAACDRDLAVIILPSFEDNDRVSFLDIPERRHLKLYDRAYAFRFYGVWGRESNPASNATSANAAMPANGRPAIGGISYKSGTIQLWSAYELLTKDSSYYKSSTSYQGGRLRLKVAKAFGRGR